jgi:hypothetical protein
MRPGVLALVVCLGGCRGVIEIPPQPSMTTIVNSPGAKAPEVIETKGVTEVIEPPPDAGRCFVRARFYKGLVERPCDEIAREVRP